MKKLLIITFLIIISGFTSLHAEASTFDISLTSNSLRYRSKYGNTIERLSQYTKFCTNVCSFTNFDLYYLYKVL